MENESKKGFKGGKKYVVVKAFCCREQKCSLVPNVFCFFSHFSVFCKFRRKKCMEGSISPTFFKQLLHAQIPKAQKSCLT